MNAPFRVDLDPRVGLADLGNPDVARSIETSRLSSTNAWKACESLLRTLVMKATMNVSATQEGSERMLLFHRLRCQMF